MNDNQLSRRRLLGAGAAFGGLALAGCSTMGSGPSIGRVVVVGGGFGGATAARYLKLWGGNVDVTLVDAATFPRDKTCGDGLTPRAIHELRLLGVDEWLRARVVSRGLRAHGFGQTLHLPWPGGSLPDYGSACARTVLDDAARRRREGTLIFGDLILWARDLLRDDAGARSIVRRRYDALLIDEFQDTDPWQVDIAEAFAADAAGGLEPGRLFMVGDPKQSIYRFRRADMAVYAAERRRVEHAGGELPALTENRRSRSVVVEWVNAVIGGVITTA